MQKLFLTALAGAFAVALVFAADWPTPSGNPQRDGWARAEKSFTKENAHGIELLYKYKTDNAARGAQALTSPIVNSNLIMYRGFKEMVVVGGSSDNAYAVDADLNRLVWKAHYEYKGDKPQAAATAVCPGGITAPIAMPGSSTGGPGRAGAGRGRAGATPQPVNARPAPVQGTRQALFTPGFGRAGVFVVVTGDGYIHGLNTSLGSDRVPPFRFLPANAKTNALNIDVATIYAATVDGCGGNPNGLYAVDMLSDNAAVMSFMTNGAGLTGSAGTSIGYDGTVYAQAPDGHGEVAGDYYDTVLALTSKELKVRDYFTPAGGRKGAKKDSSVATPVVFQHKGKDYVVSAGSDGRMYLLDAASLGGADHHTPLFASAAGGAAPTAFATYEEADGSRWIYASVPSGVKAYRLTDADGHVALAAAWTSREMIAPAAPALTNGLVFALSTGDRQKHAVLYALDAETGEELWSSGTAAATYAHGSGVAIANSRVYFTTHDNLIYCYGFFAEQPQLTGK